MMSRSYRKNYVITQEKESYRYQNRQLRHDKLAEIPKGGSYRKMYPSCGNWSYFWTEEQAMRQYKESERIRERYTEAEWLNYWAKCVKRK